MARCRPWLGTFVTIDGPDEAAIEAGFEAVARVHAAMSAHLPDSELSRLNRASGNGRDAPALGADTTAVLARALWWAERSGGLFDPVRAGGAAVARGALPLHPGQRAPDPAAQWRALRLEGGRGWLETTGCVDLGGIAKGHAVDAAVAAMRAAGAWGFVNAGGDMAAFGRPQEVAICDPMTQEARVMVTLDDSALATSAGLPAAGGGDFAHLVGRDAQLVSATVRAARAIDADALTKIVLARPSGLAALLGDVGAVALAITAGGEVIEP